ncbi:hypothetical protein AB0M48_12685 [Lentzea sp. NPDC051208]|uniref:hypothetical protein n=1 Tax=Lentzea sp. NPDC051208 TaxID=3154642 RepID=UPI00342EF8BE
MGTVAVAGHDAAVDQIGAQAGQVQRRDRLDGLDDDDRADDSPVRPQSDLEQAKQHGSSHG